MTKKSTDSETRTEPILTAQNLDPAMVYSIDIAEGIRGEGFVTRLSSNPDDVTQDLPETLRFFVCDPGEPNFKIFTLSAEEAVERNIKPERRKETKDSITLERWLKAEYVRHDE